ncbi:TetR/AcrR family transcriptional regulator [Spiractinospora alimapuensis]|uniref:TetR/AcrR family transcriptional regulator n=1 Tax=Spiractinospora alimapuensis TaxID=2820884 RepID=UPI001F3EF097|nr:TetR/AcrR family transcriptional regulator [Spiractinospora alimapuensis]QVQ54168.1 TetR/AcrR family transcriptional regulator [Spiractinospora alimapuensis]
MATTSEPNAPHLRADAQRNRDRLLADAHRVFTEAGTDAPLEEVARRAGVGIGTLYRHFPTREALLRALLHQRFATLREQGDTVAREESPRGALVAWLELLTAHVTTYRGLAATLLASGTDRNSELHEACSQAQESGAALLRRAQTARVAREDVTAEELFLLVGGVAWAAQQSGGQTTPRRLADVALRGILVGAEDQSE